MTDTASSSPPVLPRPRYVWTVVGLHVCVWDTQTLTDGQSTLMQNSEISGEAALQEMLKPWREANAVEARKSGEP